MCEHGYKVDSLLIGSPPTHDTSHDLSSCLTVVRWVEPLAAPWCQFIVCHRNCLRIIVSNSISGPLWYDRSQPLGVKDGTIQDSQLSSSSNAGGSHVVTRGRLDSTDSGSFCVGSNNADQWIQVDLLEPVTVTGVVTQGRRDYGQWVTRYQVKYGNDGTNFETIKDEDGDDHVSRFFTTLCPPIEAEAIHQQSLLSTHGWNTLF